MPPLHRKKERKKGSTPGEGVPLAHIFLPRRPSLVLPIRGFPHRMSLMLVRTGCGWELLLSPQDQTNQSMATEPLLWPWLFWEPVIKVLWSVVVKHILLGWHFANSAFLPSRYTLSKQPALECVCWHLLPLKPRGVSVVLLAQKMPTLSVLGPQTHLFGTSLPLYSFKGRGFVVSGDASACCHWGSVTECFSPAQTSGWWGHF